MADYEKLKEQIASIVRPNGRQEITALKLRDLLIYIIDTIDVKEADYQQLLKLAEDLNKKVDKETGKGLSSNDFTDAEREKLAALENYDDAEVKETLSTLVKADTELAGAIGKKVDKVDGKQLTTEDFTTALKDKLQGLNNYDDSEVKAAIEKLRGDFDTLVAGDTSAAIKSFNDIVAFLEGIEDSESLDSIIASIEQQIAGKQDEISDLETIRQGAAKGATALQAVPAEYVTQNLLDYKLSGAIFSVKRIEWADLVFLRDSATLIPGQFYRITDYVTTTTQQNTQSAGHRFDVIVLALDSHTLSEEAYACYNDEDSYFADAGANLAAWKIWYCLDNDKSRFAWADEENGKGVIYRMIDENNNKGSFDFKNIMSKCRGAMRYAIGGEEDASNSCHNNVIEAFYNCVTDSNFCKIGAGCSHVWIRHSENIKIDAGCYWVELYKCGQVAIGSNSVSIDMGDSFCVDVGAECHGVSLYNSAIVNIESGSLFVEHDGSFNEHDNSSILFWKTAPNIGDDGYGIVIMGVDYFPEYLGLAINIDPLYAMAYHTESLNLTGVNINLYIYDDESGEIIGYGYGEADIENLLSWNAYETDSFETDISRKDLTPGQSLRVEVEFAFGDVDWVFCRFSKTVTYTGQEE
jgi:hypothetical protein